MILERAEIRRKMLHILALAIPFGIAYLPRHTAIAIFVPLAGLMVTGEMLRRKFAFLQKLFMAVFGRIVRPEEENRLTGGTCFFVSGALCLILFDPPIAFTVMAFIIIGDAAAAIVGMKLGRVRFSSGKSLEGAAACICACLLFWAAFPRIDFPMAAAAAVLTAGLELVPVQLDDNLTVPVVCGIILQVWTGWGW